MIFSKKKKKDYAFLEDEIIIKKPSCTNKKIYRNKMCVIILQT